VRLSTNEWDNDARTYLRTLSAPGWKPIGECLPSGTKHTDREAYFWGSLRTYPDDVIPPLLRSDVRLENVELSDAFFWLVGLWLGDGWLRTGRAHVSPHLSRGEVLICAAKYEADVVREVIAAAGFNFSEAEMRTTVRFTICHAGLAEWLREDFGRGAAGKTVPPWAFGMRESWRAALFDGYIYADGTRPKAGHVRATSISWSLMLGRAMIARTLGYSTSMRCMTSAGNHVIENRTVSVAGATYSMDCYDKPRSCVVDQDMCWGKIKEITEFGAGEVYNLHVEEDESYVADGLIVHNCQAFSTAGKRSKGWGTERRYEHGAAQRNEDLFH
jgi:hypothetical protein